MTPREDGVWYDTKFLEADGSYSCQAVRLLGIGSTCKAVKGQSMGHQAREEALPRSSRVGELANVVSHCHELRFFSCCHTKLVQPLKLLLISVKDHLGVSHWNERL